MEDTVLNGSIKNGSKKSNHGARFTGISTRYQLYLSRKMSPATFCAMSQVPAPVVLINKKATIPIFYLVPHITHI